jgi:dipeptidyl aminopeptidase/acylaminoacyl peptidase
MDWRSTTAIAAILAACVATPALAAAPPPPAAAFGRLPAVQTAVVSPNGSHLAVLAIDKDQRAVSIIGVDDASIVTLSLADQDAEDVHWAGDDQVVVESVFLSHPRWAQPEVKYHFERAVVVDRKGRVTGRVMSNVEASIYATQLPIIGYVDGPKPQIIVEGADYSPAAMMGPMSTISSLKRKVGDITPALFRVDAVTGNGKLVDRSDGTVDTWHIDLAGEPRVMEGRDPDTHAYRVQARGKSQGPWSTVYLSGRYGDPLAFLGYSDPEDAIYYEVRTDAGLRVERRTLADGKTALVGALATRSAPQMLWDPWRMSPVAIVHTEDRDSYEWLDPEIGDLHASVSRTFKDKQVSLVTWSKDRGKVIVRVEAADAPPVWYLYDKALKSVSPIGEAYPELKGVALGSRVWIDYKAADGVTIPAYVTYPPGVTAQAASKLPLIVMPHHGPGLRDEPGFDWWAQFLATRGYVVLQPQFRGSGGFGSAFQHLGDKQWAGKMQTDLLDGITALAAKGQVDPARVCIVGWSHGGYAALEGAVTHADAYRCAVSVNGLSDLQMLMVETVSRYGRDGEGDWHVMLGDPSDSRGFLADSSPAHHAAGAGGPILLIGGRDDTVVPFEQTLRMKRALEAAGKPVELVAFKDDDHYLRSGADRTAMLEALERFLATNLPVGR